MNYTNPVVALIFSFFLFGCQKEHPSSHSIKLPVVRTSLASQPAFYQFKDRVGNAPQRAFEPNYAPKSRARNASLSREGSGVLVYTDDPAGNPHVKYILLGKERSNGYWNFVRGSVDAGNTYVQAASRELNEETGNACGVTESVLLSESFDVCYSTVAKNYACTFFVKFDYVPSDLIQESAQSQADPHFKEMSQYLWIHLDDLNAALNNNTPSFNARALQNSAEQIQFYPYSFQILQQAHSKGILSHLN